MVFTLLAAPFFFLFLLALPILILLAWLVLVLVLLARLLVGVLTLAVLVLAGLLILVVRHLTLQVSRPLGGRLTGNLVSTAESKCDELPPFHNICYAISWDRNHAPQGSVPKAFVRLSLALALEENWDCLRYGTWHEQTLV